MNPDNVKSRFQLPAYGTYDMISIVITLKVSSCPILGILPRYPICTDSGSRISML